MIKPAAPAVNAPGACLILGGAGGLSPDAQDLKAALDDHGWTTSTSVSGAGIPTGRFDLVLVDDVAGRSPGELQPLKAVGALVAGSLGGASSADWLGQLDVIFSADNARIPSLRAAGKTVHFVAPGLGGAGKRREILERHLHYRRNPYPPVDWSRISYGHAAITPDQISAGMMSAWQNEDIPARQRALVQTELKEMYQGRVPKVYQVLADALRPYAAAGMRILEVGCASGYYYEILEYLLNRPIDYVGADFSPGLVAMARSLYPEVPFLVADGANLPLPEGDFPIAISSCILLHCPNFRDHIRETARVSRKVVVAHRTPVCRRRPTQFQKKFAYGVETVELLFNEEEILEAFRGQGLRLTTAIPLGEDAASDTYSITYVFEKAEVPSEATHPGPMPEEAAAPQSAGRFTPPVATTGEAARSAFAAAVESAARSLTAPGTAGPEAGGGTQASAAARPAPSQASGLVAQGEAAYAAGDIEGARGLFLQAQRLEPSNARVLNDLGILACHDGELGKAIDLLGKAYALDDGNGRYLVNLAEVLEAMDRPDVARALVERHLDRHPGDAAVRAWNPGSVPRPPAPDAPAAPVRVAWQNRYDMHIANGGDNTVIRETIACLKALGQVADVKAEAGVDLAGWDIVHLNNISRTQDTLEQLRNAKAQGKPAVLTPLYEDMDRYLVPAMKTDLLFRFLAMRKQRIPLEAIGQVREGFQLDRHPLDDPMARRFGIGDADKRRAILEGVDCILTSGRAESEAIRRKFGQTAPISEMHYGFNRGFAGADPRLFTEKTGLRDFALCVGRLEPRKNQWQLIEVFRELPDLTLVLVGVFSDPSMEPLIKAYAPPNVVFIPRLPLEELASAYAAARLHVLPSWYELPGLVSLEAAAAGCRIATTDWGTSRDYFGDLAHYLAPDDPVRMKAVIREAFDSAPKAGLRERVAGFTWEAAAKTALLAYRRVLGRQA